MNPAPMRSATAAPRMKPRLSIPTTTSMPWPMYGAAERVDGRREAGRVAQQRGDVVEENARLRKVGDVADLRPSCPWVESVRRRWPAIGLMEENVDRDVLDAGARTRATSSLRTVRASTLPSASTSTRRPADCGRRRADLHAARHRARNHRTLTPRTRPVVRGATPSGRVGCNVSGRAREARLPAGTPHQDEQLADERQATALRHR